MLLKAARPPAIVHVVEAVRGGTARHVVDLVAASAGWDHHVVVPPAGRVATTSGAIVDDGAVEALAVLGATIHRLDMRRSPLHPRNTAAVMRLRHLLRRIDPVAVHGHSSVGGAVARLAAAATPVPAVYTPNGLAVGRAALAVEARLGPLTDALLAVSSSEADLVRRHRLVRPDRLHVVPNGIDLVPGPPDPRDLRAPLGLAPDAVLVGTVARLVPQKAPVDFVRLCGAVARRSPQTHYVLVGMGPLQPQVDVAVAAERLGERWHQVPHLPDVSGLLGQLDVFTLVSAFEGGPYTPLEAMRAGTPVVLSDVVGNADAVIDGVTGILRPFAATEATAIAVADLLADRRQRDRLVEAAEQRLRREFDVRLMGERVCALYEQLAAESPRTHAPPGVPTPVIVASAT